MVIFKEASEQDIPLIRRLAEEAWKSAYLEILSAEQIDYMLQEMYSEKEIFSHLKNPNYHYFIIEENSISAGFMGFENHYEENSTKLHRVYLLENFKGKGLGKCALEFLKEKVRDSSDHRIILNVNKNNSAQKMYESQGFNVYAEGIFDIGNGYIMDDYLMEYQF